VGGHISVASLVDEDLLSHAQQLPDQMQIVSGTPQSGPASSPLSNPLVLIAHDSAGSAVPNAVVHFGIQGNGLLSSPTATTDSSGQASVNLTLGTGAAGALTTVRADINGLPPLEFDATISGGVSSTVLTSVACSPSSLNSGAKST